MVQGTRTASPRTSTVSKVSWGAVIAGTAIAVVAQVTLLLLGMVIGLFSMGGDVGSIGSYGIGAYIWWAISGIASLFAGGWVTSRFAGLQRSFDGGREVLEQVREAGGEQAVNEITNAARQILEDGEVSDADRQRIAGLLARYTPMNQQEANALATAALWAFITLLLGAVAAGLGGRVGRVEGYVGV